jgi:hypothetical protein
MFSTLNFNHFRQINFSLLNVFYIFDIEVRDRSLFIVQGGFRRNWVGGGASYFLKPERGALKKYRETKEGGL